MACADIGSADIVALARALGVGAGASTVGNYLAHLSAVFVVAKRAWSYPLDPEAMADALFVLRKQRLVTKSNKRDRRPTLDELDRLLGHFDEVKVRAPRSAPNLRSSSSASAAEQAPCPRPGPRYEKPRCQARE